MKGCKGGEKKEFIDQEEEKKKKNEKKTVKKKNWENQSQKNVTVTNRSVKH